MFYHSNLFPLVKKGLNDKTPVTKGSSFVWISSYHYKVWVLLVISDFQTEFSKTLTHNNSKTPFHFSFWFSDNLLHKFLEKLIFRSILLFLPLALIFSVGFDFSDLLAEQEAFLEPTLATLSWRGRRGVIFNWKEREGDILEVWKMVYFHISQYQGHDKNLSCVANWSSLIKLQIKYLTFKCTLHEVFPKHFWRRL